MSVNTETGSAQGQTTVLEKEGVYASLFEKINLTPASSLGDINAFLDDAALADAPAGERLTAAMQVFMDCIRKSGQQVEKLDKTLIDHHIAELDFQISRQLDAVMHHEEFQKVESLWRGLKQLVDNTDYRQNVKTEILDVSQDDLRQDFEDAPELIQSGLYWHTYTAEYDTPGGEPIGSVISSYEFDASPQDVALLRNISKVSAAAHMPFIGSVGPKFFLKESMEEVAAIKDIGNYFDRAEYIKWKSFRDTDDSRYIGLVMPRVLGRLPYGPDNLLKPALARGELRTIAATTWSEYKQYFERDAALERRFQMVKVDEPDDDTACLMLRGLKSRYAQHHGVHITDEAVKAAVTLSRRYLTGRQLPDKAVDLLDTASARIRMSLDTVPEQLTRMKAQLTALDMEKQAMLEDIALGNSTESERLVIIEQEEIRIILALDTLETQYGQELTLTEELLACRADISRQAEIAALQSQLTAVQQGNPLLGLDVDARTVATVIADWTGVPLSSLMKDEQTELLSLEQHLAKRVVGQDAALNAIAQRLRASKTGLAPENGPQGVFLLTGPSGTGKTETALALADELFGGEKSLITINLSEYQEPHTVSQLKGSPPGYVGYGQGGILTEAVRKRPYSVVLLDEVEKAHRDVMNLFYQVFDRGFMRDGEGREIDFRNTVILMTSNLGSDLIMQLLEEQPEATEPGLQELLRPVLRNHFQPALLARFQTVIYRPLAEAAMRTIVEVKLSQVSQRLHRHYGLTTHIDESLYDALTAACLLPDTGARNVDSLLNQQILPVLSQQLLTHMAAKQKPQSLTLGWNDEEGIVLEFANV
mgnify:CR=1 FL=1